MATEAHRRIIKLTPAGRKRTTAPRAQTPQSEAPPLIPKDSPEYLNKLIRRDLLNGAHVNHRDVFPTLTTSPSVDLELYALVGLLFRSFVNRWYKSLSDDTELINELIRVVAHVTRDLEKRLADVDVLELLLDDVPLVLDEHLSAYRKVTRELGSSFLQFDTIDSAFDHVSPHMALQDTSTSRELYLKILARNILEKLLPKEEAKSMMVNRFMNALVGDLLFRIIVDKTSQPYQIFEIISMCCQLVLDQDDMPQETPQSNYDKAHSFFSSISHFIAYTTSVNITTNTTSYRPFTSFYLPHFLNNLFMVNTFRPVLYATLKATTPIFRTERVKHMLFNLLQNKLINPLKSDTLLLKILKAARKNLFPLDEDMGPPRIEPIPDEFEVIRQTAKDNLKRVCTKYHYACYLLLATNDMELDDVLDDFLTSLEHRRINEHLVLKLMDLIVMRLFPELCDVKT